MKRTTNRLVVVLLMLLAFSLLYSCKPLDESQDMGLSLSPTHKVMDDLGDTKKPELAQKAEPAKKTVATKQVKQQAKAPVKEPAKKPAAVMVKQRKPLPTKLVIEKKPKVLSLGELLEKGKSVWHLLESINIPENKVYALAIGNVLLSHKSMGEIPSALAQLQGTEIEYSRVGEMTATGIEIWLGEQNIANELPVSKKNFELGEELYLVMPAGGRFIISKTSVIAQGSEKKQDQSSSKRLAILDKGTGSAYSGALVLNLQGEVAGLVTTIQGSAFLMSVESNELRAFASKGNLWAKKYDIIIEKKVVPLLASSKLWLGMQVQELTPELAQSFGLSSDKSGVLVSKVYEDGPAFEAGIEEGDLITRMARRKIEMLEDFPRLMSKLKAGEEVPLVIRRDRKSLSKSIFPEKRPEK